VDLKLVRVAIKNAFESASSELGEAARRTVKKHVDDVIDRLVASSCSRGGRGRGVAGGAN